MHRLPTKFSGGRCEATAYRLAENDRIWLSLDGDFGRPRVSWVSASRRYDQLLEILGSEFPALAPD